MYYQISWWFGTFFPYIYIYIGNVIIPTDFHIFQRGWKCWNHQPVNLHVSFHACCDVAQTQTAAKMLLEISHPNSTRLSSFSHMSLQIIMTITVIGVTRHFADTPHYHIVGYIPPIMPSDHIIIYFPIYVHLLYPHILPNYCIQWFYPLYLSQKKSHQIPIYCFAPPIQKRTWDFTPKFPFPKRGSPWRNARFVHFLSEFRKMQIEKCSGRRGPEPLRAAKTSWDLYLL